jgi:hypothetical protein
MHFCQKHAQEQESSQQPSGSRKPSSCPSESSAHCWHSPGAGRRCDEWPALPIGEPPPSVVVAGTPLGLAPCREAVSSRRKQRRRQLTQKQRWSPGTIGTPKEERGEEDRAGPAWSFRLNTNAAICVMGEAAGTRRKVRKKAGLSKL